LAELFEFVIDSHEVGISKPDPEIFNVALERMGVRAADAWYVGDSVFHDIKGAQAARMARAVLVDPYGLGPPAIIRVRSVADLAP
jgi:putative hydrolase of the HAD superfamily